MATQCCGQQTYGIGEQPRNDKRMQLIDDIKTLIENIDNDEIGRSKETRGRAAGGGAPGNVRDPDLERQCREYRKRRGCLPPLITSIATHEFRPTSDYTKKQYDNTSQMTFIDATREAGAAEMDPMPPAPWVLPRTPSQELRAGTLYQSCECRRRNGLQHDCPRWECGGRPECVAVNPGPCCVPSKARKPVRGDRRVKTQTQARQGAEVTGQTPQTSVGRQDPGATAPGLVVPVFVRVGGQAQQQAGRPVGGAITMKGPGVAYECSPVGGQHQTGPAKNPAVTYLCELQGGQRTNPGAEKIPEMPGPYESQKAGQHPQTHTRTFLCQPQGRSPKEGTEKITEMPGPHGWPAGGKKIPENSQNTPRVYLLEPQGGQQPIQVGPQMPQGNPMTFKGPGVTCLCRPAAGQEPPQGPHQNPHQPQFGGPGTQQTPQGPVTFQGPGVTCVCRPAAPSPARPQPQQPQTGGRGYVDLYELVVIGQPGPSH